MLVLCSVLHDALTCVSLTMERRTIKTSILDGCLLFRLHVLKTVALFMQLNENIVTVELDRDTEESK